jgi:hypothetical protein
MTLVSCWVLDLPLCLPGIHSLQSILTNGKPSGPSPVCCPSTTTQCSHTESVDAAVTTFVGCCGRLLWPVALRVPWENGYKEVFWRLAINGVRAASAYQRYFSAPCPCGVVGSGAQGDCEQMRQHAFWECAIAQVVHTQVHRGLGGALLQQWHLWLVDPPPAVCEMVSRVVVMAAFWAMEQGYACDLWFISLLGRGLLCSRPFPKLPPPSGLPCMLCPA